MRSSSYAIYNDKEYRVTDNLKDEVEIISRDVKELKNGFERLIEFGRVTSSFIKMVKKEELESLYSIRSYLIIDGVRLQATSRDEKEVVISSSGNRYIAEKFNMKDRERGVYLKIIEIGAHTILEVINYKKKSPDKETGKLIKEGTYGMYKGKECKIIENLKDEVIIDPKDLGKIRA